MDTAVDEPTARARRGRGDRGQAFVAALVVLFTFTGAAAVWLARDVNQRVSDRSALQSVAFQAARAGAQQLDLGSIRGSSGGAVSIDPAAATDAATGAANRLADSYDLDVRIVRQGFDGDRTDTWSVTLALDAGGEGVEGSMTVTGVAHAEVGG